MKTFKVVFKGSTPVIVHAKDELDAALKVASKLSLKLDCFCYAIEINSRPDVWGEAA